MKDNQNAPLILLSCGGTGGHMTPAQALAQDLLARGFRVAVVTDVRGLKYRPLFQETPMHAVRSGTGGAGLAAKFKGLAQIVAGVLQAIRLVRRLKPSLVVGFGGYPSVPAVLAAQILNLPTIIHEQNAIIGKANDFLAARANRIAISWPQVQGLDEKESARAVVTGNPVRPEISQLYTRPYPNLDRDGELKIFIMGGSLGARSFSDVIPKAFMRLSASYRARLQIVQQCRAEDIDHVRRLYDEHGIEADLAPFFNDVAEQIAACHLLIVRSGASTVAEVTAAGRPAIFVPYPHHKDQQQKMNADVVADAGGGWVMMESGFTPEALANRLETFLQNPELLFSAAEKSRACGRPDAARKLGNLVTSMVSGWQG